MTTDSLVPHRLTTAVTLLHMARWSDRHSGHFGEHSGHLPPGTAALAARSGAKRDSLAEKGTPRKGEKLTWGNRHGVCGRGWLIAGRACYATAIVASPAGLAEWFFSLHLTRPK